MTIERSTSAPTAGHATARSQSGGHAGRAVHGPGAGVGLADGFSSLLLGLGDGAGDTAAGTVPQPGIFAGENGDSGGQVGDAALAAPSSAQALLAQLLGQAGSATGGLPVPDRDIPADQEALSGGQPDGVASSGATAGLLQGHAGGSAIAPASLPGASPRGGLKEGVESLALAVGDAGVETTAGWHGSRAVAMRSGSGKGEPWHHGQKTQGSQSEAQNAQSLVGTAPVGKVPDVTPASPLSRLTEAAALPGVMSALVDAGDVGGSRRRERPAAGVERFRPEGWSLAGAGSASIEAMPGATGGPGGVTSAPAADVAMAEQVRCWIANDIQNAELKVDGLNGDAVQVNISLSGNEAQVVFRSDQAHTRELLGGAVAQLDQMLRDQGLSLTAAWVGGSGAHGGQTSPRHRSDQVLAGLTSVTEPGPAQVSSVRMVVTDRTVDLFV